MKELEIFEPVLYCSTGVCGSGLTNKGFSANSYHSDYSLYQMHGILLLLKKFQNKTA